MDFTLELTIGLLALVLGTLAFLTASYVLGVLGLVVGAVSFGMLLARPPAPG